MRSRCICRQKFHVGFDGAPLAGGPAPLIATAARRDRIGYVIACYIAFCAVVSIIATVLFPDYTNRDISQEHA